LSYRTSLTEIQAGIQKTIDQAVDLLKQMRGLSHRLHPPNLDFLGLEAAANAHCNDLADQQRVNIRLHSEKVPRDLPQEVSLCLFRILQEALQNAIRHSGVHDFSVFLRGITNEIELVVQDGGTGFQIEQALKSGGIGLRSMKERLKLLNGNLSIDSKLGRGTTIRARLPLIRELL
jgi:signal transduction histidine kinase